MSAFSGMIYQAAAIAVRNGKVCVVRSSSGKRWVIPKGCLESGKSLGDIALQEAWEEAGLVGILNPEPVGSYLYDKWENTCHVTVYLMEVTEVAEEYPESMLRERLWLEPNRALARINDRGLRAVLRKALKEDRIHIEA